MPPHAESKILGPDGEPWLPADPFHDYSGPSVFGPATDGDGADPITHSSSPASNASTPTLDSDAELTHLPPGLDSPPHLDSLPTLDQAPAADIQRLCDAVLTAPTSPVLQLPLGGTTQSHSEEVQLGTPKRRSKRIAAQPSTSAKPAEKAHDTKLKKMGFPVPVEDPKASEVQQLLLTYKGNDPEAVTAALTALFAGQARVA
jgi:hypothetical protein